MLAALNGGAAALALAALHIGGAVVSRGSGPPAAISDTGASASTPRATATAVPGPHLAPRFAATPDKATLFSPPVVSPGTFAEGIGGAGSGFAPAPSPAATPVAQSHATNVAPATTAPHLAVTAHHTEVAALAPVVGPLAMTDAMLDAPVDAASVVGTVGSTADGAGVAGAVASTATTATSTVASVASSVGGAVSGGVASVGGTVGGVAASVGGAVGGVAAAAGAH